MQAHEHPKRPAELSLQTLLTELARVRCHGFSEAEVAAARSQEMAEAESQYCERDQVYSTVSKLLEKTFLLLPESGHRAACMHDDYFCRFCNEVL